MNELQERAYKLGRDAGENAAAWVEQDTIGGRVTRNERENAQALIDQLESGEIFDSVRLPDLSGEYAGDPTPASLADDLGIDPDSEGAEWDIDEACTAYEEGVSDGFRDALHRAASAVIEA